jgi:hypothetical protein
LPLHRLDLLNLGFSDIGLGGGDSLGGLGTFNIRLGRSHLRFGDRGVGLGDLGLAPGIVQLLVGDSLARRQFLLTFVGRVLKGQSL